MFCCMRCIQHIEVKVEVDGIKVGISKGWGWLDEEEKVKVLLGQDMCLEGGERVDSSMKSYLKKVMDKRRRWMGLGTRTQ